jgi:hypothetical protein
MIIGIKGLRLKVGVHILTNGCFEFFDLFLPILN